LQQALPPVCIQAERPGSKKERLRQSNAFKQFYIKRICLSCGMSRTPGYVKIIGVSVYAKPIGAILENARSAGRCNDESAAATAASFECGAAIRFSINIDPATKNIEDIRYSTNGCGVMVAAAETIVTETRKTRLTDLHGSLQIARSMLMSFSEVPIGRTHCIEVALQAFRNALAQHRAKLIEEFHSETALICTCFGVTEETIVDLIENKYMRDISDISAACNAGLGCGSCQMLVRELIDSRAPDRGFESVL
jgi:NifU-like protein